MIRGPDVTYACTPGVLRSSAGYTGGKAAWPDYGKVQDHFEAVLVEFDPTTVSFSQLLDIHFASHDPTYRSNNKNQYNSGVWTQPNTEQAAVLQKALLQQAQRRQRPIKTEVGELGKAQFYYAEDYHQKYMNRGLLRAAKDRL